MGDDAAWLRTLAGQRLVDADALHLYDLPLETGGYAFIAGDGTATLWPLGWVAETQYQAGEAVAGWLAAWATATGRAPKLVAEDRLLAAVRTLGAEISVRGSGQAPTATYATGRARLTAAFDALAAGQLSLPAIDLSATLAAAALLRLWARWLPNFGESSIPFLLDQFVRRPGSIRVEPNEIVVMLDPRPLDIVLKMAGYLSSIERVAWLDNRRVRFQM